MFCVQLEILVVGVPLVAILRDVSTNGKIMGYAIMFWILPITALSLIMGPKYLAYWRAKHHVVATPKTRGRHSGNVYVSGLTSAPNDSAGGYNSSLQPSLVESVDHGHVVSSDMSSPVARMPTELLDSQATIVASNTTTATASANGTTGSSARISCEADDIPEGESHV